MSSDLFSVSELNQFIKDVINAGIPRAVWICGEIQGYDRNRSRQHLFFELVEKDPDSNEVRARVGAVIWGGSRQKIEAVLKKAENSFELKDDIEIKVLCRVDFYPPHGTVRLVVEGIDPIHTLGKISQDRQKLIAELTRTGVLLKNKSYDLPLVALNIGLITAHDSAAYNDFIDELERSGYSFRVHLARALMQGKNCEASVVEALGRLNRTEGLDLVVITRGGGSIAELSCFDSRLVAQAVAACRYPVLSAIGHEINTTITDLAAHTFLKTPTAAAQFLCERAGAYRLRIEQNRDRLIRVATERTRSGHSYLKDNAFRLSDTIARFFRSARATHVRIEESLRRLPTQVFPRKRERLDSRTRDLKRTIHLRLTTSSTKIAAMTRLVELASPTKVLAKGFSITRDSRGRAVRTSVEITTGEQLTTELASGRLISRVESVI